MSLKRATIEVLQERNDALREELGSEVKARRSAELAAGAATTKLQGMQKGWDALFLAVEVLAGATSKTTSEGRLARDAARNFLAVAGVRPPMSLGAPRPGARKKAKKTKTKKASKRRIRKEPRDSWLEAVADGRFQKMLREGRRAP